MHRRKFLKTGLGAICCCCCPGTLFANLGRSPVFVEDRLIFDRTFARLRSVQNYIGYGYFNVIGFDEVLKIANYSSKIGEFSRAEKELMDRFFSEDPSKYGFHGKKTLDRLTWTINRKNIIKVPNTGHYLFKGRSFDTYNRLLKDVGQTLFLTSGVRGVPKQMYLYMNKIKNSNYNISMASYSLAPPSHSYHSVGDFDVGKIGFGLNNFSDEFLKTYEFKRLIELKYVSIRYTQKNLDGVRFEPWHIRVD